MPANFDGKDISWNECSFLFLFCPNNSGTTIFSQYLASQLGAYLPPFGNFEGQIVPAVESLMRIKRWQPSHKYDWHLIRQEWENLSKGRTFIEASPPNMMRYQEIAKVFGADSTAMTSISSPYQYVASYLRRYGTDHTIKEIAEQWIVKATRIREIREAFPQFPFVSHETFIKKPEIVNEIIGKPHLQFTGKGKIGSEAEGIEDLTTVTISFLESEEIEMISRVLESNMDLVIFFEYEIWSSPDLIDRLKDKSEIHYLKGRQRRDKWQRRMMRRELAARLE